MTLVGDVGGTNTTLALAERRDGRFRIVGRKRYASADLSSFDEALDDYLGSPAASGIAPEACCISGAGPVVDNCAHMTNVRWVIDGNQVERRVGTRVHVINDFSAICYALPLIDTHAEIETLTLPHTDGSTPQPHGPVRAVVGAGTGLGTGYLTEDRGHYTAHPSEAGHTDFAPMDDEMLALRNYLESRWPVIPGAEQYVSGQGLKNIYECFREIGRLGPDEVTRRLDALSDAEKPAAIAAGAGDHEGLAGVMRLFVRMYARYASNAAVIFLATGGLYLAGGIAAKNERWLLENDLFMQWFERNYNDKVTPLLMSTPVVLIKDYSVSLYGAAHAAFSLT